jgi:phosphopantothenoylcysteine decarboxylase/phosphopantothenate--cysteine ligase
LLSRRVVLGVAGSVAAYKSVLLLRALQSRGAQVRVVMSRAAERFIGIHTFRSLASEVYGHSYFAQTDPSPHTSLARWAEVVVVAPATANVIANLAIGAAPDVLTGTVLCARCPIVLAPAMHEEMYLSAAVRENLERLASRGAVVVEPEYGELAGGDVGQGRLADPALIAMVVEREVRRRESSLAGRRVLVTAGGTREPIDPVRVITNRSSGKQGLALAAEAWYRGAEVVLVSTFEPGRVPFRVVRVGTAAELESALGAEGKEADVVVMAAAVADFTPKVRSADKLRRKALPDAIPIEPTPDLIASFLRSLGSSEARPFVVGFAAETGEVEAEARRKLAEKGVDVIVANDVSEPGAGFEADTNRVLIIGRDGRSVQTGLMSKEAVAAEIWDFTEEALQARQAGKDALSDRERGGSA